MVIWVSDLTDISVPKEMLSEDIRNAFYKNNSTLLFVKFAGNSSSESTMKAIGEISQIASKQSFLSGLNKLVQSTEQLKASQNTGQ